MMITAVHQLQVIVILLTTLLLLLSFVVPVISEDDRYIDITTSSGLSSSSSESTTTTTTTTAAANDETNRILMESQEEEEERKHVPISFIADDDNNNNKAFKNEKQRKNDKLWNDSIQKGTEMMKEWYKINCDFDDSSESSESSESSDNNNNNNNKDESESESEMTMKNDIDNDQVLLYSYKIIIDDDMILENTERLTKAICYVLEKKVDKATEELLALHDKYHNNKNSLVSISTMSSKKSKSKSEWEKCQLNLDCLLSELNDMVQSVVFPFISSVPVQSSDESSSSDVDSTMMLRRGTTSDKTANNNNNNNKDDDDSDKSWWRKIIRNPFSKKSKDDSVDVNVKVKNSNLPYVQSFFNQDKNSNNKDKTTTTTTTTTIAHDVDEMWHDFVDHVHADTDKLVKDMTTEHKNPFYLGIDSSKDSSKDAVKMQIKNDKEKDDFFQIQNQKLDNIRHRISDKIHHDVDYIAKELNTEHQNPLYIGVTDEVKNQQNWYKIMSDFHHETDVIQNKFNAKGKELVEKFEKEQQKQRNTKSDVWEKLVDKYHHDTENLTNSFNKEKQDLVKKLEEDRKEFVKKLETKKVETKNSMTDFYDHLPSVKSSGLLMPMSTTNAISSSVARSRTDGTPLFLRPAVSSRKAKTQPRRSSTVAMGARFPHHTGRMYYDAPLRNDSPTRLRYPPASQSYYLRPRIYVEDARPPVAKKRQRRSDSTPQKYVDPFEIFNGLLGFPGMNEFFGNDIESVFRDDIFGLVSKEGELIRGFQDEGDRYVLALSLNLPGLTEDDIEMSIKDNILYIDAVKEDSFKKDEDGYMARQETFTGSIHQQINLPTDASPDDIEASFKDGNLKINFHKHEAAITENAATRKSLDFTNDQKDFLDKYFESQGAMENVARESLGFTKDQRDFLDKYYTPPVAENSARKSLDFTKEQRDVLKKHHEYTEPTVAANARNSLNDFLENKKKQVGAKSKNAATRKSMDFTKNQRDTLNSVSNTKKASSGNPLDTFTGLQGLHVARDDLDLTAELSQWHEEAYGYRINVDLHQQPGEINTMRTSVLGDILTIEVTQKFQDERTDEQKKFSHYVYEDYVNSAHTQVKIPKFADPKSLVAKLGSDGIVDIHVAKKTKVGGKSRKGRNIEERNEEELFRDQQIANENLVSHSS